MIKFKTNRVPLTASFALCLAFASDASARNRVFLTNSLEFHETPYVIQFTSDHGDAVGKFRLTFPAGMVDDDVMLHTVRIGKQAEQSLLPATIDPVDPNSLLIDLPKPI